MRFGRRALFLAAGWLAAATWTAAPSRAQGAAQNPNLVVYQGDKGPGAGRHIVFIAGDHEYRSEETPPMLARIMARHYGFTCSVFSAIPRSRIGLSRSTSTAPWPRSVETSACRRRPPTRF